MTRLAPRRRASAALYPLRILAESRGACRRSAADRSLLAMHRDTKANVDRQTRMHTAVLRLPMRNCGLGAQNPGKSRCGRLIERADAQSNATQNSSIRRDHRIADGKDTLEPKSFRTVTAARPCRTLPQRIVGGARPSRRIVSTIGRSRRSARW